jgi:predicted outer membrane repeat protein
MYKYLLIILVGMINSLPGFSTQITVSGNVSGSWDADTVLVMNDLQVSSGQVLNISPGTLVQFQGHFRFRIDGQVMANGLEADSILFTVNDTTGFSNIQNGTGAWNGLWFFHLAPLNDSSVFEYCRFEFAKAAFDEDSTNWNGGAVCVREFNRLRFSHCTFANNMAYKNGGALYARNANIIVAASSFINNYCGQASLYGYGGGICLEYSNARIFKNYFTLNSSTGVGGGLSFEYSEPSVEGNHFYDNYSALGGGFTSLRSTGTKPIVNNLVEGNSSLFFGGGIAVLETTMPFINNTVVANFSGAGGGLYFNANSFSVFKNCVVWDNYDFGGEGPQVYIWDTFSAPEFYYCDMEGGLEQFGGTGGSGGGFIGIYENCFEADPNFTGNGLHPYQPLQNSICINHGTPDTTGLFIPDKDFAGNFRIMNSFIDIGAYETLVITGDNEMNLDENLIQIFPNPFGSEVNISFSIGEPQQVTITLLNAKGSLIKLIVNSHLTPGEHLYRIDNPDLDKNEYTAGMYYLQFSFGRKDITRKLIHLY